MIALMMGPEMVHETVVFNEPSRLIAQEDLILNAVIQNHLIRNLFC
jgi:hypothetical protein